MTKKLIIYGIGKFAEYIAYVFDQDSPYEVVGHCVERKVLKGQIKIASENKVIDFDDIEKKYSPKEFELFVTVGNDAIRERIFKDAKKKGYTLASHISSFADYMENLKIGENVYIGGGSGIEPFVEIEDNCILIGARIGHHVKICKNSLLSHPVVGSNVIIGQNSFLGINCSIKPDVKIGERNIIGMGAIITKDTQEGEVYSPSPTIKRTITYEKINNRHLQ